MSRTQIDLSQCSLCGSHQDLAACECHGLNLCPRCASRHLRVPVGSGATVAGHERPSARPSGIATPFDPTAYVAPVIPPVDLEGERLGELSRHHLRIILNLLDIGEYVGMKHHWKSCPSAWKRYWDGVPVLLTFTHARELIARRIEELHLDRAAVLDYPNSHFYITRSDDWKPPTLDQVIETFKVKP